MNNRIAIALIVGFLFSVMFGFLTAHKNIYYSNGWSYEKDRIVIEKGPGTTYVTEYDFRLELVLVSFLGAFGIGFLFSEKIEDKTGELYDRYNARIKSKF